MLAISLALVAVLCASLATPQTPQTVSNETEKTLVVDALPGEANVTSLPLTDMDLDSTLDDATDDDEATTPTEETSTDAPEIPEALPVAQPLVMDVSLEDADYLTMLRPPPRPMPPPGPRPGPRGRKKKQKRRRPVDQVPAKQVTINRQAPVNNVHSEVHYHRGFPKYADEYRKSRDRTREDYSLQNVDEVPYAFESIMSHVASLGEPHYKNHKSFGVDAPPSDNSADNSQRLTPISRAPPVQRQQNQPDELNQIPMQYTQFTPPLHNPYSHDLYHSATVQVTRSVPIGEHHSSTSGDWLLGFNPTGTEAPPIISPSNTLTTNTIEPSSQPPPPPFGGDVMSSAHQPTSPDSSSSYATISSSTTVTPASSSVDTKVDPKIDPKVDPRVEPSAKRATLRDILATDCPDAEDLGFCDSPPRYPTQQVNAAMRECADLVELLHAPLPEVPDDDPSSLPGEEPVCPSNRLILRPGYVRDAATGRWFVAVQSRGRIAQRIYSEKCSAAGKSCARLADSKCARNIGFRNGIRASACRQKWTMRSVLTWDPDRPTRCPQMTMVKLPDTCVCRLLPSGSNETINKQVER